MLCFPSLAFSDFNLSSVGEECELPIVQHLVVLLLVVVFLVCLAVPEQLFCDPLSMLEVFIIIAANGLSPGHLHRHRSPGLIHLRMNQIGDTVWPSLDVVVIM